MSRNKIIKNVHNVTHAPFSECRAALNSVEWNEEQAIAIIVMNRLPDVFDSATAAIADFVNSFSDLVVSFARVSLSIIEEWRDSLGKIIEESGKDMTGGTI